MSTYIHFTDEQKYRANHVDLTDFLSKQGEKLLASGREKRLASDHSITVRGNEWYDHAAEKGGYAIGFVQKFYNLSFPEAVTMLLGGQAAAYRLAEQKAEKPKPPFLLPPAHSDLRRVYAYLTKTRGIGREAVSAFAKEKLLYESCEKSKDGAKEYRNAIFVGYDENGIARHAHKRGLYTLGESYKGNVEGSDPAYSFRRMGESGRLYVFEAPIDLLSYITLYPEAWQCHSYVALCGVGGQAMMKMLELNPQLREVSLCLDNDEAGHKAAERLQNQLAESGYRCHRLISQEKDWNEDLLSLREQAQMPQAMVMT